MAEPRAALEPFPSLARAREADRFGMFVFLASEVMLFGGIFAGALAIRLEHPSEYAIASVHLHMWIGGLNTAVLLTSSLLVALAVAAVRAERPRLAGWLLASAAAAGLAFLAIKGGEYLLEYREGLMPGVNGAGLEGPVDQLFMNLYFGATGLHALHVSVGIVLLSAAVWPLGRARHDPGATLVGNIALYWHLVDIVWLFLYPVLYLARP